MTSNQATLMVLTLAGALVLSSCVSDLASERRLLAQHLPEAQKGTAHDQCMIGAIYWQGHPSLRNHAEAAKWLAKAANQGDAEAQLALGCLYMNGEGVPEDLASAVKWFAKSAAQDNADANHLLGLCYSEGKGCEADHEKAIHYISRAYGLGRKEAGDDLAKLIKAAG